MAFPQRPAWVGEYYKAWTHLHQRGGLHAGTAASPMVRTTNHHVLVKGESTVLHRQRKLNLKAKITGSSLLFFFQDELWCLYTIQPCSQPKGLTLHPGKQKPSRAVGESSPWRTWACLIREPILAPGDSPSSTGRSSPALPLETPEKLFQRRRLLSSPWLADSCSVPSENGALLRHLSPGTCEISNPEHLGHTIWPRCM